MSIAEDLTQLVGNTPLLKMSRFGAGLPATLLGKLEILNPGSSVKDRVALAMIREAERSGELKKGATIIEPTSGNTGIGLAWVGSLLGYKVILTMPESMSLERRKVLANLGAQIVLTSAAEGMNGAVKKALELKKQTPGSFIPQQFENPANPQAHYLTTGPEIWEATGGKVDIFVAGVGSSGTVVGTGRYLKEKNPQVKIVAVEPSTSAVLSGGKPGPHMIQGLGAGFIPAIYDKAIVDEILPVDSKAAIETAKAVALKEGLLAGISSGSNLYAAQVLARRPENAGKTIVTIICDKAERYLSTPLFNQD